MIKDSVQAFKWIKLSADQSNSDAQFSVANMYRYGSGVEQNINECVRYYRLSAEQGNSSAQFSLGLMYDCGLGVKRDVNESAIWWQKAAEQGNSNAQYCLGRMYRYGHGVKQDAKEGYKWFKLAAEKGDTAAQSYLARWTVDALKAVYSHSIRNEESINNSDFCGCFHCISIFPVADVKLSDLIIEKDGHRTAICPICGIDSVLGDSTVEITAELLEKMNEYYF